MSDLNDIPKRTPKLLDEAILDLCSVPLNRILELGFHIMKDFIAQKFGVAYLEVESPEEQKRLEKLFLSLTWRGK